MIVKVKSNKDKLRQNYRAARLELSHVEVKTKSKIICQSLSAEIEWSNMSRLHVYQSIAELNEIETAGFIKKLGAAYPKIKIVIGGQTKHSDFPAARYDAIIIPVLAFNKDLYRLGWGGGWYDRFLATQPQALKIGLAYDSSLISSGFPREAHDIRLDKVITESTRY